MMRRPPRSTVFPYTTPVRSQVGQWGQLTATPLDAKGNPLSGRIVTWASSAPGVAIVSTGGLVTGVATGSATITATSEGKSGSAAITVTNSLPTDEPVFRPGTDTVLWSDTFGGYTAVAAVAG